MEPVFVMKLRDDTIEQMIDDCARGKLPFSGPDSLYARVCAMGYKCTSLYEMVIAREAEIQGERP
jgi:hypothetical protein